MVIQNSNKLLKELSSIEVKIKRLEEFIQDEQLDIKLEDLLKSVLFNQ